MSSVVIGCPHQQPSSSSQQPRSSSSLWSFMSPFPPAMDYSWLLLRCIQAYQWFSTEKLLLAATQSNRHES
jgi:hypothetical protein